MAGPPSLNLLLDCIICRRGRANNNPRVLACKHGFCEKCLLDTKSLNLEGQIQCPVCWQKTPLAADGIKVLSVDSKVLAAEKALQITKKGQSCEPCSYKGIEKAACAYCMNCEFKLCEECATAHRTKAKLANHVIREEICKTHFRDFTHACMTCYAGLCFGCIVSEFHDDHDVCEVVDAKDKAFGMATEKQLLLQQEIQSIDNMINSTLDESTKKLEERRQQTEEKLNAHKTKMLESVMTALDKRDQEFHKSATQSLEKQNQSSSQASNCLNEMQVDKQEKHGKLSILKMLSKTSIDMFSAVNGIRISKTLQINGPELFDDCCETIIDPDKGVFEFKIKLSRVHQHQQMTVGKPTKQLSIDGLSFFDKKFSCLWSVLALPDGSAVLADSETDCAAEVNIKGQLIRRYKSATGKFVRGLTFRDSTIYVGSCSGEDISLFRGGQTRPIHLNPARSEISALVAEEDHLIVVNSSLRKYSLEGVLIKTLATGNFYSVSAAEYPETGKVYLVSDSGTKQLHMYKPDGSRIRSFGSPGSNDGQFRLIRESAVLPNGNIIVAGKKPHRISEFTFDGTFVRHILTEQDGLDQPVGLSISYPYLWVACSDKAIMFKWS